MLKEVRRQVIRAIHPIGNHHPVIVIEERCVVVVIHLNEVVYENVRVPITVIIHIDYVILIAVAVLPVLDSQGKCIVAQVASACLEIVLPGRIAVNPVAVDFHSLVAESDVLSVIGRVSVIYRYIVVCC